MEVSMLINLYQTIFTLNIAIILILFLSIFFSQKNNNTSLFPNLPSIGIAYDNNFSLSQKNNTYFIILLKILTILSFIPLLSNIIYQSNNIVLILNTWLVNNSFILNLELNFDLKFNIFLSVALLVSWSIIEFSYYYMHNDPFTNNFFRLLIIFLLNMIILTSSNNTFILFIGWEGVGFLSFLLISWWSTRNNANNSAIQAIVYNRIGDIGILLFFSLSITLFNSWSLSEIASLTNTTPQNNLLLLGILLAAAGKSAQFSLHPWLPAAMEGPTPVSALLHSSTMVVAGVFLLIRLAPLYQNVPTFNSLCLIVGATTTIFAATTAITQHDIKKIIAYSTTSQLGLMIVAIGLNQPNIALFHICTHAFFKAMLFLSSGSIIHSLNDEQDIRKMGGLHFLIPNTSACILLGSLALSGIPFLAGFYSKDLILELALTNFSNFLGIILSFLATLLTSVYSIRIIYFSFIKNPSFNSISPTNEENHNLTNALNRLAFGTIYSGWILSYFILFNPPISISTLLKTLALLTTLIGLSFALSIIHNLTSSNFFHFINFSNFSSNQWFYENISHHLASQLSFTTSLLLSTRNIDQGWNENLAPQNISNISLIASQNYQLSQSGYIKQYLTFSIITFLTITLASLIILY